MEAEERCKKTRLVTCRDYLKWLGFTFPSFYASHRTLLKVSVALEKIERECFQSYIHSQSVTALGSQSSSLLIT